MSYAEVFEAFPSELRLPIARLVDALKAEFEVPRADFADLKAAMQSLAEAQAAPRRAWRNWPPPRHAPRPDWTG